MTLKAAWERLTTGAVGPVRPLILPAPDRFIPLFVRLLIVLVALQTLLLTLDLAFPPDMGRAHRSSPVALDRGGAWLRALPVENGRWRIRADLARTDKSFQRRVVRIEDQRFWLHPGVDPISLVRAVGSAAIRGRVTSGASTLTMQTARLLEPRPRNVGSKLIEMVRALQLEARMSKREILALYLTLAPYGGNLEGVRAASLSYFGHEPESLTNGEQALLIALPQAPEGRRPDRYPDAARRARDLLAGAEDLVQASQSACLPLAGRFRLGVIPTIAPFLLPKALPIMRARFPKLRLFLREDLTSRLITALKSGALDAALIALPYDMAGLDWAHVVDDELLAAVPTSHAMASQASISPASLDGDELILLEDGHCLRDHVLAACGLGPPARHGEDEAFAATSLPTLVQMVGSGLGVSFVPAMAVEAGLTGQAPVTVRPLQAEHPSREIVVAWRAGSSRARDGRLLAETLRDA
eukprot:gene11865-11661_t